MQCARHQSLLVGKGSQRLGKLNLSKIEIRLGLEGCPVVKLIDVAHRLDRLAGKLPGSSVCAGDWSRDDIEALKRLASDSDGLCEGIENILNGASPVHYFVVGQLIVGVPGRACHCQSSEGIGIKKVAVRGRVRVDNVVAFRGAGGTIAGPAVVGGLTVTVPVLNRPFVISNISMTKSPATFAAVVQAPALLESNSAKAVKAAKISALFSVDFPRFMAFGTGAPWSG